MSIIIKCPHRAYIPFDSLFKLETGRALIQKHTNNIKLQRAVQEMDVVRNMAQQLFLERLGSNASSNDCASQQFSPEQKVATVEKKASINQNEKRTKLKGPALSPVLLSNMKSENRVRTRFQNGPSSDSQPNSTKTIVATGVGTSEREAPIRKGRIKAKRPTVNLMNRVQTRSQLRSRSRSPAQNTDESVVKKKVRK